MTPSKTRSDIDVFRHLAGMIHHVVRCNVDGITHAENLIHPRSPGNCINWVIGHLLAIYNGVLPLLGQESVMEQSAIARYDCGVPPLRDPTEALEFQELMTAWDEAVVCVKAGLTGFTAEALDRPAPYSPGSDADETVRSLRTTVLFHQVYHAGQLGLLRCIAGKEGAI